MPDVDVCKTRKNICYKKVSEMHLSVQEPTVIPFTGTPFIPSRVSGRGYKIRPVCVFVCLSVIQHSHSRTV